MAARIYQRAKNAMQSGKARAGEWVLEFESSRPKRPDPEPEERFATALEHARLALRIQGDTRKTALEFRKHFGWYTRGVPGAAGLRERLFQIESMAEAEAIFARYLERQEVGVAA